MRVFVLLIAVVAMALTGLALLYGRSIRTPDAAAISPVPEPDRRAQPSFKATSIAPSVKSASSIDALEAFQSLGPMMDQHLSPSEQAADIAPDLLDAILRIEGIHDPTRVGLFGAAMRMQVRPGTASMTNVFGDQWRRADDDPNIHYRAQYLAQVWLRPVVRDCEAFSKFRPISTVVVLDMLTPADCARLLDQRGDRNAASQYAKITDAALSLPTFAAPYPGGRLSPKELREVEDLGIRALREQLWFR